MGSLSHLQGIFPTQGFSDVYTLVLGFPDGSGVKNPPANAGDESLIPGSSRSLEEGNDNPFQYSCPQNPMDRGAWQAIVHGISKESDTT